MGHLVFLIGITVLWFLPGIVVRQITYKRAKAAKAEAQAKAIARLYPTEKQVV